MRTGSRQLAFACVSLFGILLTEHLPAYAAGAPTFAVYDYRGPMFTDIRNNHPFDTFSNSMAVSITMALREPLAPNMPAVHLRSPMSAVEPEIFHASAGQRIISDAEIERFAIADERTFFLFSTDATGRITEWWAHVWLPMRVGFGKSFYLIETRSDPSERYDLAHWEFEDLLGQPQWNEASAVGPALGAWKLVSSVPEPNAYALLLVGLGIVLLRVPSGVSAKVAIR